MKKTQKSGRKNEPYRLNLKEIITIRREGENSLRDGEGIRVTLNGILPFDYLANKMDNPLFPLIKLPHRLNGVT
jgi:hypothetical protein